MTLHDLTEEWRWQADNILPRHLQQLAAGSVRQSTLQQVLAHQESTRLPYSLVSRAMALGGAEARILVIDEDLARSGTGVEDRHGFQRLVAEAGPDYCGAHPRRGDVPSGPLLQRLASTAGEVCTVWAPDRRPGRHP